MHSDGLPMKSIYSEYNRQRPVASKENSVDDLPMLRNDSIHFETPNASQQNIPQAVGSGYYSQTPLRPGEMQYQQQQHRSAQNMPSNNQHSQGYPSNGHNGRAGATNYNPRGHQQFDTMFSHHTTNNNGALITPSVNGSREGGGGIVYRDRTCSGFASASKCCLGSAVFSSIASILMITSISVPYWREFTRVMSGEPVLRHEGLWIFCYQPREYGGGSAVAAYSTKRCESYLTSYKQVVGVGIDVSWLHWVRAFTLLGALCGFVGTLTSITRVSFQGFQTRRSALAAGILHMLALLFFGVISVFVYAGKSIEENTKQNVQHLSFLWGFFMAVAAGALLLLIVMCDLHDYLKKIQL